MKLCDPSIIPRCFLDLNVIRRNKTLIGAMKYTPMCMNILVIVRVSSRPFFLHWMPIPSNFSSAALSCRKWRWVWSAMYHLESGLLDCQSLIYATQWSISWSHCTRPAPCLLMLLMVRGISQMRSHTLLTLHCIFKPPWSCRIPMFCASHWLTATLLFPAQMRTWRGSIRILLASATTDFSKLEALRYVVRSEWWWIIE